MQATTEMRYHFILTTEHVTSNRKSMIKKQLSIIEGKRSNIKFIEQISNIKFIEQTDYEGKTEITQISIRDNDITFAKFITLTLIKNPSPVSFEFVCS